MEAALETGCRKGVILSLQWSQVDGIVVDDQNEFESRHPDHPSPMMIIAKGGKPPFAIFHINSLLDRNNCAWL